MRHIVLFTLFILFVMTSSTADAEGIVEVDLVDGTTISGKLISFNNGIYTIQSMTLGTLKINEDNIRTIRNKALTTEASPETGTQNGIQSLQQKMIADEDIMKMITSLLQDPDFQDILQDEALMKAISSGDLNTLKSNSKLQKLLNNSNFTNIKEALEQ